MPTIPRLLSTDFDGTIHEDFGDSPIPEAFLTRVTELRAEGVVWVINTGRDFSSLMESLGRAHAGVLPDYVVAVEREIHRHVGGHYESVEPWNSRCHADHREVFERHGPAIRPLMADIEKSHDATLYDDAWSPLCVIARSNRQMDEIQVLLEEFCGKVGQLAVVRNDVYVRLSHRGYSKGTALQEIQRLTGIAPEQTLAAGDHLNDLPMLKPEIARLLVTPSNGISMVKSQVRASGGYVAKQTTGQGTLEGLRHYGW